MDFFKKNKFWLAAGILAAAMIGTFFYSSGSLTKQITSRVGEIKAAMGKVDNVKRYSAEEGANAHPNQSTEEGMQARLNELSQSVLEAWRERFKAQQALMRWPKGVLPDDFVQEFSKYNPPETMPLTEKGQSLAMQNKLQIYRQQIPGQMKNVCAIIQTQWAFAEQLDKLELTGGGDDQGENGADQKSDAGQADAKDGAADPKRKAPAPAPIVRREIVKWSRNNQELWLNKMTQFKNRDDNEFSTALPSPSQVYMLQQDLWLLEAIFRIIREVNAKTDENGNLVVDEQGKTKMVMANDLAMIKNIDHVVFGREALSLLGNIFDASKTTTPVGGTDAVRGGFSAGRSAPGGAPSGSQQSDLHLKYDGQPAWHGRYVNANLEPIEAATVQAAVSGETLPADNLELVVAKRVPVRIAVQMDERAIPRFLAACANSPFAFEVWQVRINRHDPAEVIKLRGGGDGAVATSRQAGGAGVAGIGGPSDESTRKAANATVALRRDYDVGVEFYGIIKIYNPVNEKLLGVAQPAAP